MQNNTVWLPINYMDEYVVKGITHIERKNILQNAIENSNVQLYGFENAHNIIKTYIESGRKLPPVSNFKIENFDAQFENVEVKILDDSWLSRDFSNTKVAFAYEANRKDGGAYLIAVVFAYLVDQVGKPITGEIKNEH